jgi:hypothetical protein
MHCRISIALRERHVVNATLVEDDAKNISRAMFVWHSVVVMMLLRHHATQIIRRAIGYFHRAANKKRAARTARPPRQPVQDNQLNTVPRFRAEARAALQ